MVSPEGTGPQPGQTERGRSGLFIGAVLVIAVGFAALGALTSSDELPVAVETTTTSTSTSIGEILPPIDMDDFTVDQIQTGEPLQWTRVELGHPGYPLGLTTHEDTVYLFATATPEFQFEAGGLAGWRSIDGTSWEPLGQVIGDDYLVSMVSSTEHGLVAVGTSADGSSLMAWISPDGERWTKTEFTDGDEHYSNRHYPMAIGANSDLLVIAANTDLDRDALLAERLRAAGIDLDLSHVGWSTSWRGEEGHRLTIDGPLGMKALEIDLDELDLTPQEVEWIVEGYGGTPEAGLWVNRIGEDGWSLISLDGGEWIESIVTQADGTLILTGWGPAGRISRQSRDGVLWTDYDADREPMQMQKWGSRFVGLHVSSRPELVVSDDGLSWDPVGLAERFPLPIQWSVAALGSGDEGVALSVIGYDTSAPPEEHAPSEVITDEGHVLTLDLEQQTMELTVGDTTHTWEIYRVDVDEGIEVDPFERAVTLSDPHTGETLTRLGFEDLMRAEQAYYMQRFQSNEHRALVFTEDGSRWTIQPAAGAVGEDTWVRFLEVASGHVYAAVLDPGDAYNPFAAPDFELWVAEIP